MYRFTEDSPYSVRITRDGEDSRTHIVCFIGTSAVAEPDKASPSLIALACTLTAALNDELAPRDERDRVLSHIKQQLDELKQPAPPQPVPAVVREALELGRVFAMSDVPPSALHNICSAALAALDAPAEEELPEWAWVHSGTVTGNGDLRIKMTRDGIVQIIDAAMNHDDLRRISRATAIRAAQLRREGKA